MNFLGKELRGRRVRDGHKARTGERTGGMAIEGAGVTATGYDTKRRAVWRFAKVAKVKATGFGFVDVAKTPAIYCGVIYSRFYK